MSVQVLSPMTRVRGMLNEWECAPFPVQSQAVCVYRRRIPAHSVSDGIMAGPAHLRPARDRCCITSFHLR